MKVGDWIEMYDSPGTRGIVVPGGMGDDLQVMVSGETEPRVIWAAELAQWWEPMPTSSDAAPPPFWVREGAEFVPRTGTGNTARIYGVRSDWIAYHDHVPRALTDRLVSSGISLMSPIFFIVRWHTFREQWTPAEPPTAWARLMESDDA